jgi:hypothetical protein
VKRTEALLRDARSVLRRVDALAAKASTSYDPSRALIADVRTAAGRTQPASAAPAPKWAGVLRRGLGAVRSHGRATVTYGEMKPAAARA